MDIHLSLIYFYFIENVTENIENKCICMVKMFASWICNNVSNVLFQGNILGPVTSIQAKASKNTILRFIVKNPLVTTSINTYII